ncbi:beta-lactamase family protein [Pseudonocardia sp. KRD-291]|nr:beta-lactamase family protein [Pseudonocardia sp. KRD291]
MPGGPPGAIAVVQRGRHEKVHAAGVAEVGDRRPPKATDHMHIASTAKAFSGGVALSLVERGVLRLDDTIGSRRPDVPRRWHRVTLRQLLNHTSGVPDFIASPAAQAAVGASLGTAPAPRTLLDFVAGEDLRFTPGSRYEYSNSDNIVVGLFVEAATGRSYERELRSRVTGPLGLRDTTLPAGPALPRPFLHGYEVEEGTPPADVSEVLAGGWAWASGGVVSTPRDLNRFVRGYVGGELFRGSTQREQARFVPGGSEPPGPGRNSAGLALFRYETPCGTVYGHTGNTLGYTQFAVAGRDGQRSATLSITAQRTQTSTGRDAAVFAALRAAELDAVCAAMARH